MREHARRLGYRPVPTILETGHSIEWRSAEHAWIERMRGEGLALTNKTVGRNGAQTHGDAARAKISAAARIAPRTADQYEKIAAAQRGRKKRWSAAGAEKVRGAGFAPGHRTWEALSDEQKEDHRERSRAQWRAIPSAERSAKARERTKKAWECRGPDQRKTVRRAISEGILRAISPDERSRKASRAAKALFADGAEASANVSRSMRGWWANMTPEFRKEYLARRTAALVAAKKAKSIQPPQLAY